MFSNLHYGQGGATLQLSWTSWLRFAANYRRFAAESVHGQSWQFQRSKSETTDIL